MTLLLILFTKLASTISRLLNLGNGSTWPGHIALTADKHIIKRIIETSDCQIVVVAGTNGKTTTARMIRHVLEKQGKRVLQNDSGANLLNGIASTILLHSTLFGKLKTDVALFEVDENALIHVLEEVTPDYLVLLNLFRDQLDRYGEVRTIARNWQIALEKLPKETTLVLNEDDPEISYLSEFTHGKTASFGMEHTTNKEDDYTSDSTYCPRCSGKLTYTTRLYSHLGKWSCPHCKLKHTSTNLSTVSSYPLSGMYNKYNTHASVLTCTLLGINKSDCITSLSDFTPAFGRQETISYKGKTVQIFLSKNPAGFNQSLETIMEKKPHAIVFILNDRVPDGRDISWIWDTNIENYSFDSIAVFATGDRAYDMGIRLKYAGCKKLATIEQIEDAINTALNDVSTNETLFIVPTYSAMLETRKILTGRKIL